MKSVKKDTFWKIKYNVEYNVGTIISDLTPFEFWDKLWEILVTPVGNNVNRTWICIYAQIEEKLNETN